MIKDWQRAFLGQNLTLHKVLFMEKKVMLSLPEIKIYTDIKLTLALTPEAIKVCQKLL